MQKRITQEENWLLRDKYHGRRGADFYRDLNKLKRGVPVDYLIGWKDFLGCRIDLSQKPFIPRIETEYWVEEVIKKYRDTPGTLRILDIFAGSGCIGIAFLKHLVNCRVDFVDSHVNSLKQIEINLKINQIAPSRVRVIYSDIFSHLNTFTSGSSGYDLIVANPPYVATGDLVESRVKEYEPPSALFAGASGLEVISLFLKEAHQYLAPAGRIFMEHAPHQKSALEELLRKLGYRGWEFKRDQFGRWRWATIW